jgi:hypothetical protein
MTFPTAEEERAECAAAVAAEFKRAITECEVAFAHYTREGNAATAAAWEAAFAKCKVAYALFSATMGELGLGDE